MLPDASATPWRVPQETQQARYYARHPPTWTLLDTLCPPLPARHTGSPAGDLDYGTIATKDLWPRVAWAPLIAQRQRAAAPPAHVINNPHFNADDSSSSGEESVDLDSQHYRTLKSSPKHVTRRRMQRHRNRTLRRTPCHAIPHNLMPLIHNLTLRHEVVAAHCYL